MEMFYSELNDVDQIIIKNILEQTEFDLENVQETAMFEKKMKDIFTFKLVEEMCLQVAIIV